MAEPGLPVRWTFSISSTLRQIYVMRLFLFAGGLAVAFGVAERLIAHTERPLLAIGVGFAVGLFVFRGQLRPLRWPRLFLSQRALHLVQRKQIVTLPWTAVKEISTADGLVTLSLREPMTAPDGQPTEAIRLEARKFGTASAELARELNELNGDPARRQQLPPEDRVLASLGTPAA